MSDTATEFMSVAAPTIGPVHDAQVGDHIALTPEAAGRAEDPARHARVGPDDLIFGEVDGWIGVHVRELRWLRVRYRYHGERRQDGPSHEMRR
ncbi:hypothetical protein IQ271_05060 [Mycobacteroides abscessus subsp. massiliense]|nr:hypothetical protein [Mycobacteroides abscessus subsp. massiliense]NOR97994.1 hypothetical protein [Mycobacteroides abscessus]MBL3746517.1 hypothetical protein [Mycobacteroides abscessus subsp. massiliense]MBL3759510.1 hypothetical protein [Mycobacteroides abscessus subsp. massiliense]NOS17813.1 hypothetical protein [Mycobacteroides abscessus]